MSDIDPDDLAAFHRVLDAAAHLREDDPRSVEVQRAVGRMFKLAKRVRRREANAARVAADRSVLEATATGSARRIDDETAGILLSTPTTGDSAGELTRPQNCYICKTPYTRVDAFYHQLCPECAANSHAKRDARCDLRGRRALLTGGRAKIGMYIALRLLRDGADLTITTRFPADAARRFAELVDSSEWLDRLTIVGIDLRDPAQVASLAKDVAAEGHLDILINNAAQTVRRLPGAYSSLADAESLELPASVQAALAGRVRSYGRASEAHPAALTAAIGSTAADRSRSAAALTALALHGGSASLQRLADGTAIDAGGLLPDLVHTNSWVQSVESVEPLELLEVQLCNSVAPFLLISGLRGALAASPHRRSYIVNVSAMEGQFSRAYKGPGHPHTNMAKAALNMLTRTSSQEMFDTDQILMTAVDTGWITDERPHYTKVRLADEGFRAPLDLVDGAARVYDPIVSGENGVDLYGCFLKDFAPSPW